MIPPKKHTSVIRMGAAHNDLTITIPASQTLRPGETHHVDLPPPPEPYRGKGAPSRTYLQGRDKKLALLGKIGRDLCAAYGIENRRKAKSKRFVVTGIEASAPVPEVRLAA